MVDHDYRLPPELKNILQSVRVFGNFEQPVFLELCKQCSRFSNNFLITLFVQRLEKKEYFLGLLIYFIAN